MTTDPTDRPCSTLDMLHRDLDNLRCRFDAAPMSESVARERIAAIDSLEAQIRAVRQGARFYTFSVDVVLEPGAVDNEAGGAYWVSALLSDNPDVATWGYRRDEAGHYAYPRPVPPGVAGDPGDEEAILAEARAVPYLAPEGSGGGCAVPWPG